MNKLIEELSEYLEFMGDELNDQLNCYEADNPCGNSNCPMCTTAAFLKRNETGTMAELHKLGKDNPKATLYLLSKNYQQLQAHSLMVEFLIAKTAELFTEELELTNE